MKYIAFFLFVLVAAAGIGGADYFNQKRLAQGDFDSRRYVASLIERLDGSGGVIGMAFRKSSMVTSALPTAPEGWTAVHWMDVPYGYAYSAAQEKALDFHLTKAVGNPEIFDRITDEDVAFFEAYMADTTRIYQNDDSYFELSIDVEGVEIGSAVWREYDALVQAYFDKATRRSAYAEFQGLAWTELHGPIEAADNGGLPHRLRAFEAEMGKVTLYMETRAPDVLIDRFLASIDLTNLHALNDHEAARVAQVAAMDAPGSAVVVDRAAGGCGAGQFCSASRD
ncbi:hypothetical protein KUH32_10885 [Thalassococcus sp. CAU 1522]|uniref:DUF4852 domain-containing protein n=1 Tax=Thalassococcus arenae TaxID=2851652 RepID=A0ABS6N8F8_9RHOB|nr:hypothetical protein [Thalassococcus arenae]MBV2360282.1 hypothetical protein [Thalassococcus arenae]